MANRQNLSERDLAEVAGGWHLEADPTGATQGYIVSDSTYDNCPRVAGQEHPHYFASWALARRDFNDDYEAMVIRQRADGHTVIQLRSISRNQDVTTTAEALAFMHANFPAS